VVLRPRSAESRSENKPERKPGPAAASDAPRYRAEACPACGHFTVEARSGACAACGAKGETLAMGRLAELA